MIVFINQDRCIGCVVCADRCPLDTIRISESGQAFIAYPDDCMTCYVCERKCPVGAIEIDPHKEVLPRVYETEAAGRTEISGN
mgnify:CR=1 FL=1